MVEPIDHLTGLSGASLSVLAVECDGDSAAGTGDGEILASHDPDRALAPASNTKLVTSAVALDVLGPDYRFETRVVGRGRIEDAHLRGDLLLEGSGAPDLGADDFDELAASVAEEVEAIEGDLLLDGSRFSDEQLGPGWTWGDEQYAYGARSSALALDRNTVEVRISAPDSDDSDFDVSVAPDSPEVEVRTDLSSGDDDLRVVADHETDEIRVEGTLPPSDRTERAPVARPERHCGEVFREALAEAGVAVGGEVRIADDAREDSDTNDSSAFSASVRSAPLRDLLREMNVPSDNFVAEQLARAVSSERGDGSWESWEEVATAFLDDCGAAACRIRDGSGLSRYNLVTARGMVGLLDHASEAPWSEAFFASLPAPGEGTLETRLDDVSGLRAKTGTITGTSALSGRIERDGDPDVFFSAVFGGLTVEADEARRRQDEFVRALLDG